MGLIETWQDAIDVTRAMAIFWVTFSCLPLLLIWLFRGREAVDEYLSGRKAP